MHYVCLLWQEWCIMFEGWTKSYMRYVRFIFVVLFNIHTYLDACNIEQMTKFGLKSFCCSE